MKQLSVLFGGTALARLVSVQSWTVKIPKIVQIVINRTFFQTKLDFFCVK